MANVLEVFYKVEQSYVVTSTGVIHKETFPVHGGKCLSRKAVHTSVANVPS
jgi:hypothetical protein